ncbi:MAG: hypothetical protein CSA36_08305 [Draconibacterium sp.]|nr:MAG: hypothetical protein CSA36_08305 [Draconibacterium sp.]
MLNLQLAKEYENIDYEKGKQYARNALKGNNDSIIAEANNQLARLFFHTKELDSARYYFEKAKSNMAILNNQRNVAIINIGLGATQLREGDYNGTIKTLTESASYFEETGDKLNAAKCYSNISTALAELENFEQAIAYNTNALEIFRELKLLPFQLITLPNLAAQHFKHGDTLKSIEYNLEAEKLATTTGNKRSLSIIYNNLGSIFLDSNPQKAKNYLERTIQLKNELNLKSGMEVTLGNLGYLSMKNGNYPKAILYYKQAAELVNGKQLVFIFNQLKTCYSEMKQPTLALQYANKAQHLNDSIMNADNLKIFSEIQTKYETEKKEKEIFELKSSNLEANYKRIRNQNLLFIAIFVLILTLIFAYYMMKRARKKQGAEIKELLNKLKQQELKGLDAIIEGQEKEKQRIANDLHDNLGSRIATLRLYMREVVNVDETYREVRKIAHENHSGTFIAQGLIPSIKVMTEQISGSGGLNISVNNINVEKRIKNNIEIQIFRILQELMANIIKHARATEAIIQFSEDDNMLNIMIEDNGKGFNLKETSLGFGLTNIEKRLENLNGNITIDTDIGNGTTVILTIPL